MIGNLSEMPPNWIKVRFDEITEIVKERVENPSESGLEYFIGLEHLDTDCIRIKRFGSAKDVKSSKFICKKGDIIFGRRRTYLRKLVISDRDAVVSTDAMIFRPIGDKIHPDFLSCFMQSSIFWKTVHANSEGSMSPRIKWKTLAKQEFWVPAIEEQKKIAEVLWSIEEATVKNEGLIYTTEVLKKGLLNELLTKGIGHEKFKETEIGHIPEYWDNHSFLECMEINPESLSENTSKDLKIEYIDISSIEHTGEISKTTQYHFSESPSRARRIVRKNDVIISTVRPYLKSFAIIDYDRENLICSTGFAVLRNTDKILSNYIFQFTLSDVFMNQVKKSMVGSNYPALNQKDIQNFKIAVPSIEEQNTIINILKQQDLYITNLNKNHKNLLVLKKKLTNDYLSGKLIIPKEVL